MSPSGSWCPRATAGRSRSRSSTGAASSATAGAGSSSTPTAPTAIATPPGFITNRISLLDRGYAFAIAHIRGGDEMGYGWYLDGTRTHRTNTFNDFVDAAPRPDRPQLHQRRPDRGAGRLGRRRADGRGGQPGAGAVRRGRRRRALRRRRQHHARREPAAHPRRVERMGQSDHRRRRVPLHAELQPLRQRHAARPIRRC